MVTRIALFAPSAVMLILAAVLMVGCATDGESSYVDRTKSSEQLNEYLSEVTLQDGTRCVVYHAYKRGGLSCDFNAEPEY